MISLINKKKFVKPEDNNWFKERIVRIVKFIDDELKLDASNQACGLLISIDLLNKLNVENFIVTPKVAKSFSLFQPDYYLNLISGKQIPLKVHNNLAGAYLIQTFHGFDCRETLFDFTDAFEGIEEVKL